jgi:siroheme synthase
MTDYQSKLYLIGAGPGDPELLTLKAYRVLREVDIILYDNLVSSDLLDYIIKDLNKVPELIYVGKKARSKINKQDSINQKLADLLKQHKSIARLKGGDPLIFAQIVDELTVARNLNIQVEILAGITSALGAAAEFQFPLTIRNELENVLICSAHNLSDQKMKLWEDLIAKKTVICIYMCHNQLEILLNYFKNSKVQCTFTLISNATCSNSSILSLDPATNLNSDAKKELNNITKPLVLYINQ